MAEEPQNEPQAQAPETEEEEFDWDAFWSGEDVEKAVGAATEQMAASMSPETAEKAEQIEDQEMTRLRQELAELKTLVSTRMTNLEIQHKMEDAISTWKNQASPFEADLAYLVERSQTPEQFKANVSTVRTMAANLAKRQEEREAQLMAAAEREMQTKFGLPVTPNFQPPPRQAKIEEAVAAHDIDALASALTEGLGRP